MAVDSVRRLSERGVQQQLPFERNTQFDLVEEDSVTAIDLIGNTDIGPYPFVNQARRYWSFEFTTDPMFGSPKSVSGVLEVREGSGFVFLILDQDTPKPDTIFSELRDSTQTDFPIETDFSPTYKSVCDFIRSSSSIVKVDSPTSRNPKERIQQGENIPVEVARLRFEHEESHSITYSDAQLSIPIDTEEGALVESVAREYSFREYVVQKFESAFTQE
ncbi:hypothetical protein [Halomicrobium katesii]|uniref:hypothetical protein n=1 Tax=Halomicrobium katesii TaxID=437163 RepID=UPI0012BAC930|nr:hypothetical protein [Halomicrobium katesii]